MKSKSKKKSSVLNKDVDAVQQKYEDCVEVLGHLHNAIALALSVSSEYDDKDPLDIVQFALDEYRTFTKLSDEEVEQLRKESKSLVEQIKEVFPEIEMELVEQDDSQNKKRGLLN